MAITYSAKGTSFPSFTVGKNGVTIYQGTVDPSSEGVNGDIYFQAGSTPKLWQKATGTWNQIGNFGSKIASDDTTVDTNLVSDTITLTANGSRVLDVAHDALGVGGEKAILRNGASQIVLSVVDDSTTTPVDFVVDLQGQGSMRIQSDADAAIRTSDGSPITINPGDKSVGNGGTINITAGATTAAAASGGDIVLSPGTPGAGGAAGQVLLSSGYTPVHADSVVNRTNSNTLMIATVTTEALHAVTATEQVILVNRTTEAVTEIVLPNTNVPIGRQVTVKDAKGDADTNPILVTVNGGGNIDADVAYMISGDYGSKAFIWNGIQWFSI